MAEAASLLGNVKNDSMFPDLTFKERMYGFAACFIIGWLIDLFSFGSIFGLFTGSPTKFAITFTLGNIVSLAGTLFLVGPKKQFKNMGKPTRLVTTIVYISSMVAILVCVLFLDVPPIVLLLLVIVELCAFVWYCASYIPYGRKCLKMCFKKTINGGASDKA
mmetsp:Transcript_34916/g.31442  ORF Transcript_34916/g.31442 Transcript_34916/m.31442 type:complete len:162 (-) Transcript_34916:25-510(-)